MKTSTINESESLEDSDSQTQSGNKWLDFYNWNILVLGPLGLVILLFLLLFPLVLSTSRFFTAMFVLLGVVWFISSTILGAIGKKLTARARGGSNNSGMILRGMSYVSLLLPIVGIILTIAVLKKHLPINLILEIVRIEILFLISLLSFPFGIFIVVTVKNWKTKRFLKKRIP